MKKNVGMALALAVVLTAGLLSACAVGVGPAPGEVYVSAAPPAAEIEVAGTAPGPDYVWIHG